MRFRFWRRFKIFPGVTLNTNKRGLSVSGGIEGAQFTSSTKGSRTTFGIPGTGAFWTQRSSNGNRAKGHEEYKVSPKASKGLDIVASLVALDNKEEAIKQSKKWLWVPDVAFLVGFTALQAEYYEEAEAMFTAGLQSISNDFISPYLGMVIKPRVELSSGGFIEIEPSEEGMFIGLSLAMKNLGKVLDARMVLELAIAKEVSDGLNGVGLRLALADMILKMDEDTDERARKILDLASWVEAETVSAGSLLLIRSRALRRLGLYFETKSTLSEIIKKKARMNETILMGAYYERGIVYERMGHAKRAQADYQWVYSRDRDYEEVANKIERAKT